MKTQTYIMMVILLLVCFAAGCSTTSNINTRTNLQTIDEEPFMEGIKEETFMEEIGELATQRSKEQENWYFLGEAAKEWAEQYEWRKRFCPPERFGREQIERVANIELKF